MARMGSLPPVPLSTRKSEEFAEVFRPMVFSVEGIARRHNSTKPKP